MSTRRTKRVQTKLSIQHHSILKELTDQHYKINHLIEQAIDLVYQIETNERILHECDATKTMKLYDLIFNSNHILIHSTFLNIILEGLTEGNFVNKCKSFLETNINFSMNDEMIPFECTFRTFVKTLTFWSQFYKLFLIREINQNTQIVIVRPLFLTEYPAIITLYVVKLLDETKFNYSFIIKNGSIHFQWINEKQPKKNNKSELLTILSELPLS